MLRLDRLKMPRSVYFSKKILRQRNRADSVVNIGVATMGTQGEGEPLFWSSIVVRYSQFSMRIFLGDILRCITVFATQ